VPDEFVSFGFPVGDCGPVAAFEAEVGPLPPLPLLSPWPPLLAELFDGVGVCCGDGGGLAGAAGTLAELDTPASSNAANGCASIFWLGVDSCVADGEIGKTAAEALGILGTLGTLELREATLVVMVCLQPAGQGVLLYKFKLYQ